MLAGDSVLNGRVLFGIDHLDGSSCNRVCRATPFVVAALAASETIRVTHIEGAVRAAKDVNERHEDDDAIVL
jgi:hypothetical protein